MLNTGINPDEMVFMLKLDKRSPTFVKMINLYEQCILNKNEILSMMQDVVFDSEE
jgi:histone deacetylase complex regulatory component SIN3